MNQKKFLYFFCLLSLFFVSQASSIVRLSGDINLFHKDVLTSFDRVFMQGSSVDHETLQQFLILVHDRSENYLKQVRADLKILKKEIRFKRKKAESVDLERSLIASLEKLQKVLRKHRLQLDIIDYHALIRKQWGDLFAAVDAGQDILPMLSAKGIDLPGVKGLKALAHKIDRIKDKIEEYEYRLHTDWIDLKLANYVLRIEAIRLRNAAIFHPLYRGTSRQTAYPR